MNEFEKFFEGTQWLPDEAKVAATAQRGVNWKRHGPPPVHKCAECGRDDVPVGEFCTCPGGERNMEKWDALHRPSTWPSPKPATPEPPEWKDDGRVMMDIVDAYARSKGLPTPDPIAEFNERRKAKREGVPDDVWQRFDAYQKEDRRQLDLARAMSTPLPHDPDMHTRLMPWRGRADE